MGFLAKHKKKLIIAAAAAAVFAAALPKAVLLGAKFFAAQETVVRTDWTMDVGSVVDEDEEPVSYTHLIMAKLAIEACDVLTSIRIAQAAGAAAAGPTARWKGFYFDLDWRTTQARPGAGYGGTQATPLVCYAVAEARTNGLTIPMYGGGGVFSYDPVSYTHLMCW